MNPSLPTGSPRSVWRALLLFLLMISVGLTSCVSRSKAKADAQAAFIAGQQQAMARMQQQSLGGAVVRINGDVRQAVLPWTEGMTIATALLAADYLGPEPSEILVVRAGRAIHVNPKELLQGHDIQLLPGDIVQINPGSPQQ